MHRRGQTTTLQERLQIAEQAAGQTDAQLARTIGCSVWTVRKWRRRYRQAGRAGLTSPQGRPARGPLGTLPPELPAAIRQLRQAHPGWGPDTLLVALRTDPRWADQPLPSRARLAAFLKQAGLTRRYQRHADLPQPPRQVPHAAHQEWQVDAQGATKVPGVGTVSLINAVDVASRVKVESCPRVGCKKPGTADYFVALRRAFLTFGLPERISLDHDTVFFDNTTPSPFPTRLHLWLLALGVEVVFTRKRCPTDHALIERTHQTMTGQALAGQSWPDQAALWQGLDERRAILNTALPARALAGQPPLGAHPEAVYSGRPYRPEWEEQLLDLDRVYAYLARGRWFRYNNHGSIQLGAVSYYVDYHYDRQLMEITFDPAEVVFVCQPASGDTTIRVPARGLTKAELMGDLAALLELPAYQLALPGFTDDEPRLELVRCLMGTTF